MTQPTQTEIASTDQRSTLAPARSITTARNPSGIPVPSDETLEELSAIVRANVDEVPKLRYSEKLRGIELAGKYHHLFTDQIEVKQSVDVNISLVEVQAAVHAVVQTEHISECDAALRLAEQLADLPELAATLRKWAAGSARQQLGPRGNTITDDAVDAVLLETLATTASS